jgi:hypothetical protein
MISKPGNQELSSVVIRQNLCHSRSIIGARINTNATNFHGFFNNRKHTDPMCFPIVPYVPIVVINESI